MLHIYYISTSGSRNCACFHRHHSGKRPGARYHGQGSSHTVHRVIGVPANHLSPSLYADYQGSKDRNTSSVSAECKHPQAHPSPIKWISETRIPEEEERTRRHRHQDVGSGQVNEADDDWGPLHRRAHDAYRMTSELPAMTRTDKIGWTTVAAWNQGLTSVLALPDVLFILIKL